MSDPTPPISRFKVVARTALRIFAKVLLGALIFGMTGWVALAVMYADTAVGSPRYITAGIVVAASIAALFLIPKWRYGLLTFALIFGVVLTWYFSLKPSNDRDWTTDVSVLPWSELNGNRLIVHNVRNFHYRSETDFTPAWEDRTYDLDHLRSADYILVYWGSKALAHAIVSFGFDDGRYLAVSIETRKEKGESYSAIQGFFRQYELTYVIADERDVLRLRTDFRKEDVYLYQTRFSPAGARTALLSYLDHANRLRTQPEWYNALTTNCATSVMPHARAGGASAQMSCDILLPGYSARQVYRNGNLDDSLPFDELERRSHVNAAAVAAPDDESFSKVIRAGLPLPARVAGTAATQP